MPKRVPEEAKRVPLNCLVLPATMEYLKAAKDSQGVVVDLAVAALQMQEAQGRVVPETVKAATPRSWKRGPRPKGDKTR